MELGDLDLTFSVSRDEEYVHLEMRHAGREIDMGSRKHNYLLLTLARRRLGESAQGLPDTSSGWIDLEDLAHDPSMAPPQLNIDVFRIREQFAKAGVDRRGGHHRAAPRAAPLRDESRLDLDGLRATRASRAGPGGLPE